MKIHCVKTNILALALTILFLGCATPPVLSEYDTESVSGEIIIVLASPEVEHIDATTGNRLPQDESIIAELRSALATAIRLELSGKQIAVLDLSEIPGVDPAALSEDLGNTYRIIKSHSIELDTSQQEQLSWIAATSHASHLLFCRYRLFAGPRGHMNPLGGGIIYSSSSRLVFESHLYMIHDKKVVWSRSAQIRDHPDTGISNISTIVPLVFNTLEVK